MVVTCPRCRNVFDAADRATQRRLHEYGSGWDHSACCGDKPPRLAPEDGIADLCIAGDGGGDGEC